MDKLTEHESMVFPQPGRRKWERLEYQSRMTLVLQWGRQLEGLTQDISLDSVFLLTDQPPMGIQVGEMGTLEDLPSRGSLKFPCVVARITAQGLALSFQDRQAAFGIYITHDMMLDLLAKTNNAFANSIDLEATLRTGVTHIHRSLQAEGASLFLLEEDGAGLVCRACAGPVDITGTRLKADEGIAGRTVQAGESIIVQDTKEEPDFASWVDQASGYSTQSILTAPLIIQGNCFGVLEVINKRGSGLFATHDRAVLTALASVTALAIHNARQAAELVAQERLR